MLRLRKLLIVLDLIIFCHAFSNSSSGLNGSTSDKQYNKFIRHIFNKYGSEGVINFEGFEHLLFNLGLGNIQFSVNHTIEVHRAEGIRIPGNLWDDTNSSQTTSEWHKFVFKKLHGNTHQHDMALLHPKTATQKNPMKHCLSPFSIVTMAIDDLKPPENAHHHIMKRNKRHLVENEEIINDLKITPEMFMKLCPALVVQIDNHDCIEEDEPENTSSYTYVQAWLYASFSILIISACGLFGLLIVPIAKSTNYNIILGFLVAIAVGTLLGDSLMHLLPHALVPHQHNDDFYKHKDKRDENEPIFICLCALLAAVFMYSLENLMPLIGGGHSHQHSHHNGTHKEESHEMNGSHVQKKSKKLSPVAFMVVIGDGLHNITDGLAIGAAFVIDPITGFSTSLAVLCHELPHELGDFALLLKTGVSIRKACHLNIVSSVLSFIGMAIGLAISTHETAKWIYAATAGTFMYIALSDLVPEMQKDKDRGCKQILIQILGVLIGCGIMLLIGLYEESLRYLFE